MWAVSNQTRFKADRCFARDADGAEIWIVAVKATFLIGLDGAVTAADEQEDVCLAPQYFGEPSESSLRYDMDLVRTKPGTDIVLHAHAHAPGGRPTPVVDVGVAVGSVSKQLRVFGDRVWKRGLTGLFPSSPEPFVSLPIRYERAWGGPLPSGDASHPFNPVGVGANAASGTPVPNCESPDAPIDSPRHNGTRAGFGPIPFHWQPRTGLGGTYDDAWRETRQPLVPLDFQEGYFRCAPPDQQIAGYLRGGEEVVLYNLTAEGLLRFRLPRITLGFRTRIDGGITDHRCQLHTVVIEPELRRLLMVWQTALPCHHTLYTLTETVVFEKEPVALGVSA